MALWRPKPRPPPSLAPPPPLPTMSDTLHTDLHSRDQILNVFEAFRDEIDDHNDRRERLIKASSTLSY